MKSIISEKDLIKCLTNLRDSIQQFDYSKISNVIFLNLESFYYFIQRISCKELGYAKTVKELINILEPYIPITLDEYNINFLLQCTNLKENDLEKYHELLVQKSKIDFINLVRNSKTHSEWNYVINLVTSVRDLKENTN